MDESEHLPDQGNLDAQELTQTMAHASLGEIGEQTAWESAQNREFEQSFIASLTTQTLTKAPENIHINRATINPDTGHMEGGGSGDGGGGGGGDGGGDGGDSDDGNGGGGQGAGTQGAPNAPNPTRMIGREPSIFAGDHEKAEDFLIQWKLYAQLNARHVTMRNKYEKALLFLTYIQGPLVNEWMTAMSNWLENETTAMGVDEYDNWLWREVALSFA